MELKEMTIEEMETRKAEIVAETDVEGADLDALEAEMKSINEEMETRKAERRKFGMSSQNHGLSERKKQILKAIVDAHIEGGGPVGSKYILQNQTNLLSYIK